jgi:hypothetical protein
VCGSSIGGSAGRASVKNSHSPFGLCATGPIGQPLLRSVSNALLTTSKGALHTSNITPVGSRMFHG